MNAAVPRSQQHPSDPTGVKTNPLTGLAHGQVLTPDRGPDEDPAPIRETAGKQHSTTLDNRAPTQVRPTGTRTPRRSDHRRRGRARPPANPRPDRRDLAQLAHRPTDHALLDRV